MKDTLVHPWMIDPRTGLALEALGIRADGRPIWPIMGASEDDDSGDGGDDEDDAGDEGDDEGGDEDEDDDDPDAGKSPEDLRAELKALRRSKEKLLREAKNRRNGNGRKDRDDDGKDGDGKVKTFTRDDVDDLVEETKASARQELMPAIIRSQSRTVLESLGMAFPTESAKARAQLSRVLKLADIDELDLNDDGEVEGLEHAFRSVKRDFPQLFKGKRTSSPGNLGGGGRTRTKAVSATELQMKHAFGKSDDD